MKQKNIFDELDAKFEAHKINKTLDINSIEELIIEDMATYKEKLFKHIEELICNDIDESELISKKNNYGTNWDLRLKTKENKK